MAEVVLTYVSVSQAANWLSLPAQLAKQALTRAEVPEQLVEQLAETLEQFVEPLEVLEQLVEQLLSLAEVC